MEHEHGSGSGSTTHQNAHPEAIVNVHPGDTNTSSGTSPNLLPETTSKDENPPNHEKKLGYSSSRSSSSSSSSNPLELDSDHEKDFLDESRSPIPDSQSSPDDPTNTPQWSMMSVSPRAGLGPPTGSGLLSSSKVSPTVQVMGRPPGYDPNRIPSAVFSTKPAASTMEWSVASNESLFSIHMGNNSFSRDHSMFFSKSGELNRPEDWMSSPYSVTDTNMSSGLPTVIEAAENDRKSASTAEEYGEREDQVAETHHVVSNKDSAIEKEKLPNASEGLQVSAGANPSAASDGKGVVNPAEGARNSASTPRLSDESGNSVSSFAFPVFGSESSQKVDNEKPRPPPVPEAEAEAKPETPLTTPKVDENRSWFNCFSCCPLCR